MPFKQMYCIFVVLLFGVVLTSCRHQTTQSKMEVWEYLAHDLDHISSMFYLYPCRLFFILTRYFVKQVLWFAFLSLLVIHFDVHYGGNKPYKDICIFKCTLFYMYLALNRQLYYHSNFQCARFVVCISQIVFTTRLFSM